MMCFRNLPVCQPFFSPCFQSCQKLRTSRLLSPRSESTYPIGKSFLRRSTVWRHFGVTGLSHCVLIAKEPDLANRRGFGHRIKPGDSYEVLSLFWIILHLACNDPQQRPISRRSGRRWARIDLPRHCLKSATKNSMIVEEE